MRIKDARWALLPWAIVSMAAGCLSTPPPPAPGNQLEPIATTPDPSGLLWYDVHDLTVEGAGWPDAAVHYRRLPDRAQGLVRAPVWDLSQHSSGLRVRFITDAHEISLRWTLREARIALDHMPASGVSGFDLYARDGSTWQWVGLARPAKSGDTTTRILKDIPAEPHEYLLYFPLYNGVTTAAIGVNPDATMRAVPVQPGRPLVFYGTSITQGASASRAGMTYPAQLARRLDVPFINLGFAGNGTMDLEMADLLVEVDARAYVIDCLPNMDRHGVDARAGSFIESLHRARPGSPIILVESMVPRNAWFLPWQQQAAAENTAALWDVVNRLDAGIRRHLYVVSSDHLLGPTSESAVDGLHPSDLGFVCMTDALELVLRKALRRSSR